MKYKNLMGTIECILCAYKGILKNICQEFGLTVVEVHVIGFLHNNPGLDTAVDIAEGRMLAKSNISQAVDDLIKKNLLIREVDSADRRRVHLHLTADAAAVTEKLDREWEFFWDELYEGFSESEIALHNSLRERVTRNAARLVEENRFNHGHRVSVHECGARF